MWLQEKDFAERLNAGEQKKHNEAELEKNSWEANPFEYEEELAQAKAQLEEYAELMKKNWRKRKPICVEMDATVETANDITNTEEDVGTQWYDVSGRWKIQELNDRFNRGTAKSIRQNPVADGILNRSVYGWMLMSAGVSDKPMKLGAIKVIKKMKKHGGSGELNRPEAGSANPIAV